ncbi:hypothetical protein M8818_005998 [Zalaria obscura]|uniref:Uncharacterized protein n=1 Tax=Zalaria obscura TaxID=2024903 RepID=A0ACC3S726_9PEZI
MYLNPGGGQTLGLEITMTCIQWVKMLKTSTQSMPFPFLTHLHTLHLPIARRPNLPSNKFARIDRHQTNRTNSRNSPPKAERDDIMQIKVASKEWQAAKIDRCSAQDAEDHDGVPGRDLRSDHDQFVDDEHREADGDHALEACLVVLG